MQIADSDFEGPYTIDTTVIPDNKAAVYTIICHAKNGKNYVTDVGESGETGKRLANHERRPSWGQNCDGSLAAYLRYMPSSAGYDAADRRKLENRIRQQYDPPCGKR